MESAIKMNSIPTPRGGRSSARAKRPSGAHLETAIKWLDAGFSPLPPKDDGSKSPFADLKDTQTGRPTWRPYQEKPADRRRVESWYRGGRTANGVVTGFAGLELLEFDDRGVYDQYREAAAKSGLGSLLSRIEEGYLEETPKGGMHLFYVCDELRGNTKLAQRPAAEESPGPSPLIETRGQGGFAVVAPSCGTVHPTGRPYILLHGGPGSIVTITSAERDALWDLARTFDEVPTEFIEPRALNGRKPGRSEGRPGDAFEAEHSWEDILEPFGWRKLFVRGDVAYWQRPGKEGPGVSATTGHCKGLYVFSTSTSFQAGRSYSKFGAYAHLHHGGDHSAAARELAAHYRNGNADGDGGAEGNANGRRNGKPRKGQNGPAEGNGRHACDEKAESEKQMDALLRLARDAAYFKDPEGQAYACVPANGHTEVHKVHSKRFRQWLSYRFYEARGRCASSATLQDVLHNLDAEAYMRGRTERVYVRTGGDTDRAVIDLGDDDWRAVEITADGWAIKAKTDVRFRRPDGMRPIPTPVKGGDISALRRFVRCDDDDFLLMVTWLCAAILPAGPYPILVLTGEQGSAKSTHARLLRRLIDPHVSEIRAEPEKNRDLVVSAVNGWVFAIDNISTLPNWLSDALCRLSTGGGHASRTNYTMDEVTYLDAQRPVILTGIGEFIRRGDLTDRSLFTTLPPIPEGERRTEKALRDEFDAAAPYIVGALFDLVSRGMALLPTVGESGLPRMADFGRFAEAVSRAMGNEAGHFLRIYRSARKSANEAEVEDSPVAEAIQKLMDSPAVIETEGLWHGTSKDLLRAIAELTGKDAVERETKARNWPGSPEQMASALRRLAPSLRAVGIDTKWPARTKRARILTLFRLPSECSGNQPSPPSPPSPGPKNKAF